MRDEGEGGKGGWVGGGGGGGGRGNGGNPAKCGGGGKKWARCKADMKCGVGCDWWGVLLGVGRNDD